METPALDPAKISATAIDFFAGPDEGIDIYELYPKKIGLEIIGVNSTSELLLKIWRKTDEGITVKIDYGTRFSTEGSGFPVKTNLEYRGIQGNTFNVNFVPAVDYSPILVQAGGSVQDMAARKSYSLKMSKANANNFDWLKNIRDRNISAYPNSGIFLAAFEPSDQPYKYTLKIPVVCIDREKEIPGENDKFTLQPKLTTPEFVPLLRELDKRKASRDVSQMVVWLFREEQELASDKKTPDEIIEYVEILVKYFDAISADVSDILNRMSEEEYELLLDEIMEFFTEDF